MSTLHALTVPKWGMSMEEGEVTEWQVSVGDTLAVGDGIVDIETSKIVNTAESSCAGILVRITGQPGDTLRVGDLLGVVAEGEYNDEDVDAFVAGFEPDAAGAARSDAAAGGRAEHTRAEPPAAAAAAAPSDAAELATGPDDSAVHASSVARRIARAQGVNLHNVRATGRNGRVSKRDVERAAGIRVLAPAAAAPQVSAERSTPSRSSADDSHIASTPVARRTARALHINLNDVVATGKRGRVTREDVERTARALTGVASYRQKKLDGMRKTIAARLCESKQTIPHYRVSVDIEIDSLLQQRQYMNSELGHSLSVNDFVIKACAGALSRVPEVNVQYAGDSLRFFEQVDIAMAVAVEGGLITPVIRDVGSKSLPQIAAESSDLARRAQRGTQANDEFQGGPVRIYNQGLFGVDELDAIIKPPQAAILAVAAGSRKPVVRGDHIEAATVMRVTLSSDHRVIDGAVAARFLQALKGFLENPASMLL